MKRSKPLARRSPLRSRPKLRLVEPGRDAWKEPLYGSCSVCGAQGRLVRHHTLYEQVVRREGGDPWDLRNALPLGSPFLCSCHHDQHQAVRRIRLEVIPNAALDFCIEVLGVERAALWLASHYDGVFRGDEPEAAA